MRDQSEENDKIDRALFTAPPTSLPVDIRDAQSRLLTHQDFIRAASAASDNICGIAVALMGDSAYIHIRMLDETKADETFDAVRAIKNRCDLQLKLLVWP